MHLGIAEKPVLKMLLIADAVVDNPTVV